MLPADGFAPFPATVTMYFRPLSVVTSSPTFTPPSSSSALATRGVDVTAATVAAAARPALLRKATRLCCAPWEEDEEEAEQVMTLRLEEPPALKTATVEGVGDGGSF